jgi:RNA polymerase sigma factor (sigma-70 family)
LATITSVGRASGVEPLDLAFDSPAVSALYERNAGRVFGYCLSRLGRREDAEDAVQTTFLHAIRGLRRGVVPLIESAWLLGIARNVCLSRREAFGRRNRVESTTDPVELDQGSAAPDGRGEELIGIEDALARLPERQRRAVLLRDWRGLSYDEIAARLGVSRAAVETLIFRGRRTLAEHLREEPRTTRDRIANLGNLGSLLAAVKTAFAGGAVKVAVAVAVVSGAGLAVGPGVDSPLRSAGTDVPRLAETELPRVSAGGLRAAPATAAVPTVQPRASAGAAAPVRSRVAPKRAGAAAQASAAAPAGEAESTASEPMAAPWPVAVLPALAAEPPVPTSPVPTSPVPTSPVPTSVVTKVVTVVQPSVSPQPIATPEPLPVPPVAGLPVPAPQVPQLPQLPVPAPQLPVPPVAAPALPIAPPAVPPAPVGPPAVPPVPPGLPPLLP